MSTIEGNPFRQWVRLEQPRLGTQVVAASDEFFGAKERLIDPAEPVFIADKYDDHGKWMDGWESRRKRTPGHDHCIVRLGIPGRVHGLDIDTRHFTGNYPPAASVDACCSDREIPDDSSWYPLLERTELGGDAHHYVDVEHAEPLTHLRLNIFPDGGVARLRVFGEVRPDWESLDDDTRLDLFALANGGRALICNDEHFGSMHNLNLDGRGVDMGDGWETARRRTPGNDWVVLKLGHRGVVDEVVVDTAHFKGNYPDRVMLQAALADGSPEQLAGESENWEVLLPERKLEADSEHVFQIEEGLGPVSHLRMSIFPDGGISRLRLYGRLVRDT